MSRVVDEIREFYGAFGGGRPGVVAVSGGADSVALLRGFLAAGVAGVSVGHFNHRLRGAESDADEAFVRELAAGLGVPFHAGAADVVAGGEGVEAAARRLRYDWLARLARDTGAGWVATGHTADDQAETVLHRLVRGTGLRGLGGIPDWWELKPGVEVFRPLLRVTRSEVAEYLRTLGQPHREDPSNADPAFTRNRIRHELIPLLETFNPAVVDVLNRLARQADGALAVLTPMAAKGLQNAELPRAGDVLVFDPPKLIPLQEYLIAEVFRLVWDREGWPQRDLTADHWDRVVRVVRGELAAADFPGGVFVRRAGRVVQLGRRS